MIFYALFSYIDYCIYSLCSSILMLIFDITKFEIFSEGVIQQFTQRVYIILGVVMLFKIMISCVQYLINPDKLGDEKSGLGSIFKRVLICVVLLAFIPSVFNLAKSAQESISKALPNIVLGNDSSSMTSDENILETGNEMAFNVLMTFVSAKKAIPASVKIEDFDSFVLNVTNGCSSGGLDFEGWFTTSKCTYNYTIILSTIAGAFMVWIFISMAFDVAIREIKLGILQIMSPIPIASYIDPKTENTFNTWVKTSITVYCDLFVRFIVIYFIMFFMKKILDTDNINRLYSTIGDQTRGTFVLLFIVLGLLLFAKEAPKFICDMLGMKDSAGFKDMFTRAGGLTGSALAGLKTARSNYTTQEERLKGKGLSKGKQVAGALRSAFAGAGSATGRGLLMTGQGKGLNDIRRNAFEKAIKARNERNDRVDNLYQDRYLKDADGNYQLDENGHKVANPNAYSRRDYIRDRRRADLGIPTESGFVESQYKTIEDITQSLVNQKGHGAKKSSETPNVVFESNNQEKGFGTITNGDGQIEVVRKMSIGQAQAMASIQVGSLYDDGHKAERASRMLAEASYASRSSESEYRRIANNYELMKQAKAQNPNSVTDQQLADQKISLELARDKHQKNLQHIENLKNDKNLGMVTMSETTSSEWKQMQQSIEKKYSYKKESDLLHNGDPDAIKGIEHTVKLLRDNQNLFTGNPEYNQILADASDKLGLEGDERFSNLGELMQALNKKETKTFTENGRQVTREVYAMSPELLEAAKTAMENVGAQAYQASLEAADRAKRSQKVQNDKK